MKKVFLGLALLTMLFVGGCQKEEIAVDQADQALELKSGDIIPGNYVVVYNETPTMLRSITGDYESRVTAMKAQSMNIFRDAGIAADAIKIAYSGTIYGVAAKLTAQEVRALQNDRRIAYVEPDIIISLPELRQESFATPEAQTTPWGITRVGGFANYTGTKRAWIIDTGIQSNHPDLNVDVANSKTFVPRSKNFEDENGHGTHVAGTVAAKNNDIGVVGVAAGAPVVAVRVLDRKGSGAYSTIIAGVDYVGTKGVAGDVANMSLGGPAYTALDDAVKAAANKGIRFTLAAGNESQNANNVSPARAYGTNIYTISAMATGNLWASFSNFANPPIDYCAPGVSVLSCWIKSTYKSISGTSMAAPHAAGVLLLGNPTTDGYVQNDPDGTPDPIIHR
ncbi:MAG: S8 family serine peptidase [Bacteroidales bacterium]|nr:S8 family serine peptidase [Bacteroidales bacterium]